MEETFCLLTEDYTIRKTDSQKRLSKNTHKKRPSFPKGVLSVFFQS